MHFVVPAMGQCVGEVHDLRVAAVLGKELGPQAEHAEHPGEPLAERLTGRDCVGNHVEGIAMAWPSL